MPNLNHWSVVGAPIFRCSRFGLCAAIASAIGLLVAVPAHADDPGDLKAFVGKYPFDRVRGHSLLQVPELRSRLQMLLGRKGADDINRMNTVAPIEEHSGWLVAGGCRPHNCAWEQWTVAINLSDYSVLVCLGIEGQPVKFAATGEKTVERPPPNSDPCRWGADALAALQKVFPAAF